jgi:hypothetical protein
LFLIIVAYAIDANVDVSPSAAAAAFDLSMCHRLLVLTHSHHHGLFRQQLLSMIIIWLFWLRLIA